MSRCDFRSLGECGCPADTCDVQKPDTPEPTVSFPWRYQLAAVATGIVITCFLFVALSAANERIHIENLRNQEAKITWK